MDSTSQLGEMGFEVDKELHTVYRMVRDVLMIFLIPGTGPTEIQGLHTCQGLNPFD